MTMTIEGFVAAVAATARALPGVKAAPDTPPEAMHQFPFAMTYPGPFDITGAANPQTKRIVTVICEIHCARQLLPVAVAQATPLGNAFGIALWADQSLGGAVNHINTVHGDFVYFEFAGTKTIGWRFEIVGKMED